MTNSEREGDGATRLWSLAAGCPDPDERQLLKRHAVDESHHAVAYLALLDRCFPAAVEPEFHEQLRGLSPQYAMSHDLATVEGSPYAHEPSIDDYVQVNIAEIRTTIHHTMQREALALHCPSDNATGITKILDSILRDELNHVGYTAELIERKAAGWIRGCSRVCSPSGSRISDGSPAKNSARWFSTDDIRSRSER